MELPKVDLHSFLRNFYPGFLMLVLLYLLPDSGMVNKVTTLIEKQPWIALVIIVVVGIGFSSFYKAVIFRYVIRIVESWFGIRQWEFHRVLVARVAEEIKASPDRVKSCQSTFAADACRSVLLSTLESEGSAINMINSIVHVLFMTGVLCFAFFLYSWLQINQTNWLAFALFLAFIASGVLLDHNEADHREQVILYRHQDEYNKIVRAYLSEE